MIKVKHYNEKQANRMHKSNKWFDIEGNDEINAFNRARRGYSWSKLSRRVTGANLFNNVSLSGHMPYECVIGIINPIYKNKGDISDPDNYRGITLLTCFGIFFTSILNNLTMWLAGWPCVCGNQLLERLVPPSPTSQLCWRPHSHESVLFFRIFGIHSFLSF